MLNVVLTTEMQDRLAARRMPGLDPARENMLWSTSLRSRHTELLVLCARIGFNP